MARICKATKTAQLSPRTEIQIGCGISKDDHNIVHKTHQTIGDLSIVFVWPGDFEE